MCVSVLYVLTLSINLSIYRKNDPTGPTGCSRCKKAYKTMSSHLSQSHGELNVEERTLLPRLVSGRVNIRRASCPVESC